MHKKFYWLLLAVLITTLDLVTKHVAIERLLPYEPIKVLSFFNLTLAFNKGAAFSFLHAASGWQNIFFITVAIVISLSLLFWLIKLDINQRLQACAITLILGGAWGNLYDRIKFGFVIDFIDLHLGKYHWPIFNIADCAICLGAGIMIMLIARSEKQTTTVA